MATFIRFGLYIRLVHLFWLGFYYTTVESFVPFCINMIFSHKVFQIQCFVFAIILFLGRKEFWQFTWQIVCQSFTKFLSSRGLHADRVLVFHRIRSHSSKLFTYILQFEKKHLTGLGNRIYLSVSQPPPPALPIYIILLKSYVGILGLSKRVT